MSQYPKISTAIPKRRYQFGEYQASLLGEIESPDMARYRFIMAFIEEGANEPSLYVCCQHAKPNQRADGRYLLRVINSALDEILDQSDELADLSVFAEVALDTGNKILNLGDSKPWQTM
ncbi:MAG: hypothetical protein KZQ58_10620 [gamma proteobacterium symbiont of Bathyaustriella thionipta]|nr:hypothetical protein [gamma proteobacterium symbiont of Bathyaustriella thionipta]